MTTQSKMIMGGIIAGCLGLASAAFAQENGGTGQLQLQIQPTLPILPLLRCDECWAVVNANATLARGKDVALVTKGDVATGSYVVKFKRSVAACSYVATIGNSGAGVASPAHITVAARSGDPSAVYVAVHGPTGIGRPDAPFHLQIEC
jgi:hypothetical protein